MIPPIRDEEGIHAVVREVYSPILQREFRTAPAREVSGKNDFQLKVRSAALPCPNV